MNKRVVNFAIVGLIVGVLVAEFYPKLFLNAFGDFRAEFAGPFSRYRNNLAVQYGLATAALGLVIGFLMDQTGGKKR